MATLSRAAARLLTALPRDLDNLRVISDRKPSAHLADLQRSRRRSAPVRATSASTACGTAWFRERRLLARACRRSKSCSGHAGSDGGAIRSLGVRLCQGVRRRRPSALTHRPTHPELIAGPFRGHSGKPFRRGKGMGASACERTSRKQSFCELGEGKDAERNAVRRRSIPAAMGDCDGKGASDAHAYRQVRR